MCYPNGTNENKMRKHCCLGPQLPYNLNNSLSLNWPITNQMSCPDIFTWMDSRSYKICPQVCYIWLYWKKNLISRILVSFLMEKHLLLNKYTPILFYIIFHAQILILILNLDTWSQKMSKAKGAGLTALIATFKISIKGTSLVVQWLGLCTSIAGGMGSVPG